VESEAVERTWKRSQTAVKVCAIVSAVILLLLVGLGVLVWLGFRAVNKTAAADGSRAVQRLMNALADGDPKKVQLGLAAKPSARPIPAGLPERVHWLACDATPEVVKELAARDPERYRAALDLDLEWFDSMNGLAQVRGKVRTRSGATYHLRALIELGDPDVEPAVIELETSPEPIPPR
jgi:hypothetical protein